MSRWRVTRLRRRPVIALAAAWLLAALPHLAPAQLLAFPEAEGFGRFATGARTSLGSATVYHVTNLNDSGAGSFRDAVSQSNRFVVFDVGGVVNLDSVVSVKSNITIAGQTAPGGISIYGEKVSFTSANNLVSRYVAIRKGNAGVRDDAASLARGTNMIFDHMSVTWGVDETFSMNPDSGYVIDNITIQNTIIAQGQDRLGHSAGGLMTLGEGYHFSVIKSLFADSVTRNPKVRGENEYVNNVVYGWETAAYIMGDTTSMDSHANAIGNYFIEGPVNGGSPFTSGTANFHIYGRDNWVDANRNGALDGSAVTSYPGADVVANPFAFPTTAAMTAQQALAHVMANAGLSITRDAVDTRLMQEVASYGTLGGVIQRETDLFPGYGTDPKYVNFRARTTDADNDGIADNWEAAHGLSAANATDWKTLNTAGYTRLEEYLNELGAAGATVNSTGGTWTAAATWTGGAAPTLADHAVAAGTLNVSSGNAFARRLTLGGALNVTGGTLDVFDTATVNGAVTVGGGTATFGQLLLASPGQTASLALSTGGTLQTGTIATGGGTATFNWNGGTIRATGVPNVTLATTLGAAGGTFDTNGYSGTYSGRITGSGALVKAGVGTLTLSGNNAYTGGTTVTGNLRLAHNNGAGTGPVSVTSAGGAVQLANGVTVANNINTSYLFEVLDVPDAGATATYAGNLTRNGTTQVRIQATGAGATLNVTGSITAPNGFYLKTGNLVVAGNGSITGGGGAAVGRGGGATSLTLRDGANFSVGAFSMGGGQALPSGMITVRDNATLSTGAANLDLLNTTTTASSATLNLDGGTTTVGAFAKTSTGATQTVVLNFNGGLLRYGGGTPSANFLSVLTGLTANVRAGGARIDDNGQTITIARPLIHDPALAAADGGLTKSGAGTLVLTAANTYTGPTTVNIGTLRVTGSIAASAGVTVAAGAVFDVGASQSLKALTLSGGHADLHDYALVVDYAPAVTTPRDAVRDAIAAGLLTSSSLTDDTAVGYAEAADVLTFTNGAATFNGRTVDATSLLLRRTLTADANLDASVDFNDLVRLAQNYNTTGRYWSDGDFTRDGDVDFDDLVKLAQNYNTTLSPAATIPGAPAAFTDDLARAFATVPEPATSALLALSACGLAGTRRRRR